MYGENPQDIKKINAVKNRTLASFSIVRAYLTIPFSYQTIPHLWSFLRTVGYNFFLPQFLKKFKLSKVPVIHVDHPLDNKVPFTPSKVDIYLGFVNFWISPLCMLIKRYGIHKAMPFCSDFLSKIQKTYHAASKIYKFCLTTTNRPNYTKNKAFKVIHRFDPHFMCVPSLHIAIVVLCYSYYRNLFEKEKFTKTEKNKWLPELYGNAIAITETVLYIKQHSVNCIPAALYMMVKCFPDLFSIEDAVTFIDNILVKSDNVKEQDRIAIRNYIQFMFERLLLESCCYDNWDIPIKHWMFDYAKKTNQKIYGRTIILN